MEESELLGAQALYQANAYFQSSARQGRDCRDQNIELLKQRSAFDKERLDLEYRANHAEVDARSYQKQLSSLQKKKQLEVQQVVQDYQGSEPFLRFMDDHNDEMCPMNMSLGWDRDVNVISHQYPNVVHPCNFPTPDWVVSKGCYVEQGPVEGAVPQASGSASRGSRRTSSSQPREKRVVQQDKGQAVMREPLPGKGHRNQLSSSSDSDSSEGEEDAEEGPAGKEVVAETSSGEEVSSSGEESGSEEGEEGPAPEE